MPYLIGPNKAAITPKPASAQNSTTTDCCAKPITAKPATKISKNFSHCATRALSYRSASSPPSADKKKYGAMKIALASVISASASARAPNRIKKTSVVLRKLSLNAAKNWHQNSGAKRLDSIRGGGITLVLQSSGVGVCPPCNKKGGLPAAQVIAQTEPNLETEFPAIGRIDRNCGKAQGNSDDGGHGKQCCPHG